MSEEQHLFVWFLAWVAIGLLLLILLSRRWQSHFDAFASKRSSTTIAFLALFWPILLIWLTLLEITSQPQRPLASHLPPAAVASAPSMLQPPTPVLFAVPALLLGAATTSLAVLTTQQWPALLGFSLGLFLPAGAILLGMIAGAGYGFGSRRSARYRLGRFAAVGGLFGVAALVGARATVCLGLAPELSLLACYDGLLTHTQLVFSGRSGDFTTSELGMIGYLREVLFALGAFGGAIISVGAVHVLAHPAPNRAA